MNMQIPMRETDGDKAVRANLWAATEREIMRFAEKYAGAAVDGEWSTDRQDKIAAAAKKKGYPKSLIRLGGKLLKGTKAARRDLAAFRVALGL